MTEEQFARWRDFSTRMALRGFPDATEARRTNIARWVEEWFAFLTLKPPAWSSWLGWEESESENRHGAADETFDRWAEELPGYSSGVAERYYRGRRWRFLTQILCCVQAGLNMVGKPSAGVLGWTVGDLRRMYDGVIPNWINERYEADLSIAPDDEQILL